MDPPFPGWVRATISILFLLGSFKLHSSYKTGTALLQHLIFCPKVCMYLIDPCNEPYIEEMSERAYVLSFLVSQLMSDGTQKCILNIRIVPAQYKIGCPFLIDTDWGGLKESCTGIQNIAVIRIEHKFYVNIFL